MSARREPRDWEWKFTGEGGAEAPYHDFWYLVCDTNDIHSDCTFYFSLDDADFEEDETWIREVIATLAELFPEAKKRGEMFCYTCW